MTGNFQRGLSNDRNTAMDEAMILSVEADVAPDTLRVSLQWQGNHDISDFDLQRFGKVLQIQDETEHTGWAIIERRFHARIAPAVWTFRERQCSGNSAIFRYLIFFAGLGDRLRVVTFGNGVIIRSGA